MEDSVRVSVVCATDLAPIVPFTEDEGALGTTEIDFLTTPPSALRREVSRIATRGGGVVAVTDRKDEMAPLRAAGADQVILAISPGRDVRASVVRAVSDAREQALQRKRRVEHLRALVEDVRAGNAEPNALLAGIALELLERPIHRVSDSPLWSGANAARFRNPDAAAALRESLYVLEAVHELQASTRNPTSSPASCDIESVANYVAPMLRIAFGEGVDVRVVPRRGPYRTPVTEWRVATTILAASVALAYSGADGTEEPDEPLERANRSAGEADFAPESDAQHGQLRASSPFHISTSPPPGRAAVTIGLLGMGDLVRLYVATDLAEPDALPSGCVAAQDREAPSDPAHAALLLAAICVNPWDGLVDVSPGPDGGASISIFLPGDGPPLDGSVTA